MPPPVRGGIRVHGFPVKATARRADASDMERPPETGEPRSGVLESRDVWFYPRRIARPAPPTAYTPSQAVDLVAHPPATDLVADRRVLRPPRHHLQPVPPPPPEPVAEPAAEHAPPAASPARPDAAGLRREAPAASWWRRLLARLHRPHHRPRHRARGL